MTPAAEAAGAAGATGKDAGDASTATPPITPDSTGAVPRLHAERITLGYAGGAQVLTELTASITPGTFTVILGPNGCGKSTLLRAFGRILQPEQGAVTLDGRAIAQFTPREFARAVALLPQSAITPEGVTAGDLVARGRYPHQGLFRQWSRQDERAVSWALDRTGTREFADRRITDLSGGQRQRVWIAMALAQDSGTLLLDEPTSYLDLAHQLEVLDLCRLLIEEHGKTIIAVLHDLNHAARYADRIIVMRDGRVIAEGEPAEIITGELLRDAFGVECRIVPDPVTGTPLVVPERGRSRGHPASFPPSSGAVG